MEKQLTRKVSLDTHHHGCLFNIFSYFAFRQNRQFRRLLSDREQNEKLLPGSTGNTTHIYINPGIERGIHVDEEGKVKKRRKSRKMFSKARIKAFIVGEMMKKKVSPQRIPPISSRLQRLYSIHHMGSEDMEISSEENLHSSDKSSSLTSSSSSDSLEESNLLAVCSEELPHSCTGCELIRAKNLLVEDKVEVVGKQLLQKQALLEDFLNEVGKSSSKEQIGDKEISKEGWQSPKIMDALEVLNTNREQFLKILKDIDHPLSGHFQGSSRKNPLLTKSGTYPGTRSNIFSTRKHDRRSSNVSSIVTDLEDKIMSSDQSISTTSSELKTDPLNNIRRKIKQMLKENKKEHLRVSLDAALHKVPYGPNSPDGQISAAQSDRRDTPKSGTSFESEGLRGGNFKRSASLTESIERYSQLFESISHKDNMIKRSRTLKVSDSANENESLLERRVRWKTNGRNHSLPNITFHYLDPGSEDETALHLHNSSYKLVDVTPNVGNFSEKSSTQDLLTTSIPEEDEKPEEDLSVRVTLAKNSISTESIASLQYQENFCNDDNLDSSELDNENDVRAISALEIVEDVNELSCYIQDDVSIAVESFLMEDKELKLEDEVTSEIPNQVNIEESHESSENQVIIEDEPGFINLCDYLIPPNFHVDKGNEADFFYVRNLLQQSGFDGQIFLESFHSPDVPILDPSLFDELEGSPTKLEPIGGCSLDHLLLFDLMNEVLFEIYDKNSSSSSSCGLFSFQMSRPLPIGHYVLEEVWGRISWLLDFRPRIDTSLEQVKARDLSKYDGWMDTQMDSECLVLDMEEWLLDDMLDDMLDDLVEDLELA